MTIKYTFSPCVFFNITHDKFSNCSLVKTKDLVNRTVYFNNINDKTLWLLKWSKEIDEYNRAGNKAEAIMNNMVKKITYEMDKNIIEMLTTGKTLI